MNKINYDRILVVSVFILVALVFTSLMLKLPEGNELIYIPVEKQPVLGDINAPIEMVIFEDLQCPGCKIFHEKILPHIKKRYLDTGYVKLHIISVPFFEGSDLAAKVCLLMHKKYPEYFESFFYKIVGLANSENISMQKIVGICQGFPKLDLLTFQDEIRNFSNKEFEKNYQIAKQVMKDVETPTIYIEGRKINSINLSEIFQRVDCYMKDKNYDQI